MVKLQNKINIMITPFETMSEKELKMVRHSYLWKLLPPATLFLFLFLVILIYTGLNRNSGLTTILLTVSAFIAGNILFFSTTRDHRLDLQLRKVSIEKAVVEDKIHKLDYEPGSATIPVNLLSILFINKIASREMKELHIYSIIAGGEKYYTDKISFKKIETGSTILIRRAENTKLFLGIEAI